MFECLQREEKESQGQWQNEWTREMGCDAAGMRRCPLMLVHETGQHGWPLFSSRSSRMGLCPVMTSHLSSSCSSISPAPNNILQAFTKRLREETIREGDVPMRHILCSPSTKATEIWKVSCSSGPWRAILNGGFQSHLPHFSCTLCFLIPGSSCLQGSSWSWVGLTLACLTGNQVASPGLPPPATH